MSHIDDETMALLGLGEPVDATSERHLAECARCAAERDELARVAGTVRSGGPVVLEQPAPHVWDRIAAELDSTETLPVGGSRNLEGSEPDEPDQPLGPTSHETEARWKRRSAWVAAASFLVGVGGTATVMSLTGGEPEPPILARAELDPLPGYRTSGTAAVHDVDGRQVLSVDLPDTDANGFLEVWLLDAEAERLVSLGVLVGPDGVFDIPPGLDLDEFSIVDVSDEAYDGDPGHGGDSVVRGSLA